MELFEGFLARVIERSCLSSRVPVGETLALDVRIETELSFLNTNVPSSASDSWFGFVTSTDR